MVSAKAAIERLLRLKDSKTHWAIDVRSPGEFHKGSFPNSINIPILNDDHRHQVGLTYKQVGKEAAIALGHQLVDPIRDQLVREWLSFTNAQQEVLLFCWRGGLRSRTTAQWIEEAGGKALVVEGGYKAIRAEILKSFEKPYEILTLTGSTGSGKTELLKNIPGAIDLEALSYHRGSAFGGHSDFPQPSQQLFENRLGIELLTSTGPIVLEDESRMIGKIVIPLPILNQMKSAPLIKMNIPLLERAARIYDEYVLREQDLDSIRTRYIQCIERISKRLGGTRASELIEKMTTAFDSGNKEDHLGWIKQLLEEYYDPSYQMSFERTPRKVAFSGDRQECETYLLRSTVPKQGTQSSGNQKQHQIENQSPIVGLSVS